MKTDDVTRGNEEVLAARIGNGSQMRIGAIGWDNTGTRRATLRVQLGVGVEARSERRGFEWD